MGGILGSFWVQLICADLCFFLGLRFYDFLRESFSLAEWGISRFWRNSINSVGKIIPWFSC